MFKALRKNDKGFTLIELLIVVAIIGILAAIAIPQFAAYRQRAYNSAALSDLRNAKTAEESLYAEIQAYGSTDGASVALAAALPDAGGALNLGPMPAALGGATPADGSRVAGQNDQGAVAAMAFGISNGVNLIASCSQSALDGYNSYVVAARHEQGDTAYAADSDNTTTVYRVSNPAWIGVLDLISATVPDPTISNDDLNGEEGGGAPQANWTLM